MASIMEGSDMTEKQMMKLLTQVEYALLDAIGAAEKARMEVKVARIQLQQKAKKDENTNRSGR